MSFAKYQHYQASGLDWLGRVPEHWQLRRLGYFFDERREKVSDKDFPPLSVTKNGVVPQLETAAKTDDGDNRKKVVAADFVINSRSDRKGSAGLAGQDGSVSLINIVLTPLAAVNGQFVHYLLRCSAFQEEFYRFGKGIVADLWSTNYSEMRNILLAVPPLPEQAAIATFLARETAKIDALVEEQRRLIDLLKEKRQAVISHAVTKGLNPDAPMKDSGVEWLGEVPSHWGLGVLRRFVDAVQTGRTPKTESPSEEIEAGVPWFTPGDFDGGLRLKSATKLVPRSAVDSGDASYFPVGSVLVVSIGGTLGKVGLPNSPSSANQQINAVTPSKSLSSEFLAYSLSVKQSAMRYLSNASTIGIMNQDKTKEIPFTLPPMAEQFKIVAYLDLLSANLDLLTTEAESTITLLQERRAALISAAVTGKIDVRGIVVDDAQASAAAPVRETVDA